MTEVEAVTLLSEVRIGRRGRSVGLGDLPASRLRSVWVGGRAEV